MPTKLKMKRVTGLPSSGEERLITALFYDSATAERAYAALIRNGLDKQEISIAMSEATCKHRFGGSPAPLQHSRGDNRDAGGSAEMLRDLAGEVATVAFPGVTIMLSGPLSTALAEMGACRFGGSLIGGLVVAGIPVKQVKHFERGLKAGGILVSVHPRSDAEAACAEDVFRQYHAEHVCVRQTAED